MKLIHIQILRFSAATSVVLFHSLGTGQNYFGVPVRTWLTIFSYGGFGVDLFFVISGFIIYYSAHYREEHAGQFLRRRIERIVPIYWIFTMAFLAAALGFPVQFKSSEILDTKLIGSSLFYVSFLLGRMPVLYVGWSLEYEMLFYLAVFTLLHFRRNRVWDLLIVCFCFLILTGLACGPGAEGTVGGAAFVFLTSPLLLEFVLGIVAARYVLQGSIPWRSTLLIIATFASVVMLATEDVRDRVAIVGLSAAILVALAARTDLATNKPGRIKGALATLGDAAYSIYLIQIFTVSVACKFLKALSPSLPLEAAVFGSAVFTLAAGYASFILIERPLLRLCRRATWPPFRSAVNLSR